jgi:hypothetical protein
MLVSHYEFHENDYNHFNFIKKCLALLWISISNADEWKSFALKSIDWKKNIENILVSIVVIMFDPAVLSSSFRFVVNVDEHVAIGSSTNLFLTVIREMKNYCDFSDNR